MKKLLLPLLALCALVLVAPALAKEPKQAAVCGSDGCETTTDRQGLLSLLDGGDPIPPPPAGAYYKVTMTIDVPPDAGAPPKVQWWYAPDGAAIRPVKLDPSGVSPWYHLTAEGRALLARVTENVEPFPLPTVTRATIAGEAVADPSSYLRLFGQKSVAPPRIDKGDWQRIVFTGPASPWTDNAVELSYSPSSQTVLRGFDAAKVPPAMASRIESRSSLDAGSSFPWLPAGLALLTLAAGAMLLLRRLRIGRAAARKLAFPLFVVGALAAAAPALAKEPSMARLCGASGCATTHDSRTLTTLLSQDGTSPPAPPPAAFYRMTVTIDAPPDVGSAARSEWTYVPSANLVFRTGIFGGGMDTWLKPGAAATALLQRTVRGIKPYDVPVPTKATVGNREVKDPASYLRLLSQQSVGRRIPSAGDWQEIHFYGAASPWTDGSLALAFSAKDGLLLRGGEVVTLPASMAARIADGSSLGGADEAFPWPLLTGAATLLLALVAAAALALLRLGRRLPRPGRFQPES